MDDKLLASRLAERFRWPIALAGGTSAALVGANLLSWFPDKLTVDAALAVGVAAAVMFCCGVFDMKFQRAVSALNFSRRSEARRRGWLTRLTGCGLPSGDRLLWSVAIILLIVTLVAGNIYHRFPAAILGFAGFFLLCMAQIALMVRGQPTDRLM